MPQVEIPFVQFQFRNIDAVEAQHFIKDFTYYLEEIKKKFIFHTLSLQETKKERSLMSQSLSRKFVIQL